MPAFAGRTGVKKLINIDISTLAPRIGATMVFVSCLNEDVQLAN